MGERLTYAEIEQRYPDEWILIGDPALNVNLAVESGVVLFHSPDRDLMYERAKEPKPRLFAVRCTKRPNEDEIIITRLLVGFECEEVIAGPPPVETP